MPTLISSQSSRPTSLMSMRPLPGSKANVNGLRNPNAQIARLMPVVAPKNGLVAGMLPSDAMRRILPSGDYRLWASSASEFSPTAMYRNPSGPK